MKAVLLALVLAPEPTPISQAQDLYTQGTSAYDSADYLRAVELFTESLNVTKQLPEPQAKPIRDQLLYNIARAHENAFAIDKDVTHLRQALLLFKRYANEAPDTGDSLDAEVSIARVEKKLRTLQQIENNRATPARVVPPPPVTEPTVDKRKRNMGIGLLSAGSAVTVTGIGILVAGATLKPKAKREINDVTGGDSMHEAWDAGQVHIGNEAQRGRIFMGIGGAVAAVGVAGVVIGAFQVKRSKRHVAVVPSVGSAFTGVTISVGSSR